MISAGILSGAVLLILYGTIREWGNSIGITLPKDLLEKEHIGKDEKVKVLVVKQSDVLKKTFGLFKGKLKKSGQEMKDQARAELYREMR